MLRNTMIKAATAAAIFAVAGLANAQTPAAAGASVKMLMDKPLIGIQGHEALMLTVTYQPGVASPPHEHKANTFVYVLDGSVVMQVKGQPEVTLHAGQTFYETPTDIHTVSRNASDTKPATILVFMVKKQGAPATYPVHTH